MLYDEETRYKTFYLTLFFIVQHVLNISHNAILPTNKDLQHAENYISDKYNLPVHDLPFTLVSKEKATNAAGFALLF